MKALVLSLSWVILIAADQESISNYKNNFDGREAPTLKPIDYSDAVFQQDFAKNPNSKIFLRYKQQVDDHVPRVEKENIRQYFRVRKPIARRKIFHIRKETLKSVSVAESNQVLNVSTVTIEPTPHEIVIRNNVEEDKHIDDALDKLPEVFEDTQETIIVPLLQESNAKNNEESATGDTEDIITAPNNIVTPQEYFINTDMRPNSQDAEKSSEPEYRDVIEKSDTPWLINKNSEDTDFIHIEETNEKTSTIRVSSYDYLESSTKVSTPELEILLLSDDELKWKLNDTVNSVPKLVVEEMIIEPKATLSPIVESKFAEISVTSKNVLHVPEESGDNNESHHQSVINPISETDTSNNKPTDIISSSVETENSELSSKIKLVGIKGRLLSNLSNAVEDSKQNVPITGNDGNKTLRSPRRRNRRRKVRKNKATSSINPEKIEDLNSNDTVLVKTEDITSTTTQVPITDVTTISIPTLSDQLRHHYDTKVRTSTPRGRFTHYQDKFRARNGIHTVAANPAEETQKRISLTSSTTTTTSPYRQYRAPSKFRKWNRNRNITPTVTNPREDLPNPPLIIALSTNNTNTTTMDEQNVSPMPNASQEHPVSANISDTIKYNGRSPLKLTTGENLETSTLTPTTISNPTTNTPRRMRFRNKFRRIRTSTQPTPSANVSTTGNTVEVISTTTLKTEENNTTTIQSTRKFTHPPPPPPTLSPWYDGFGK